ncbi:hypothetical protein [Pelagibius sp. 7325]|uniref:hypothetical protein n=1 Tax=Pelagibius sp. 7325 TaxID=3131994 RepID=UPI0030EC4F8F
MTLESALIKFRLFLTDSWPILLAFANDAGWDDDPYFLDRWQQANWELLVEQKILSGQQFLPPYGYAKEDPGLRHTNTDSAVTHRIICFDKLETVKRSYRFLCFVTRRHDTVCIDAPFDYVSLRLPNGRDVRDLPVSQVEFHLEAISGA